MNFEQEIRRLQDTAVVMAEIQRRQAEIQKLQAEGMQLHEQRMAHIDMRLANITHKLGFMVASRDRSKTHLFRVNSSPVQTSFTEQTL